MTLSKLINKAVENYKNNFGIKNILHKIDGTKEVKYLVDEREVSFLTKCIKEAYEAGKEETYKEVEKGLTKWSKKAAVLKWMKVDGCNSPDGWYDWNEILSSLLGYCGYWKYFDLLIKETHK